MEKSFVIITFFQFILLYSCAQNNFCKNTIFPGIDNSARSTRESLVEDTLQKKITLVFEQTFSDSVVIMVENHILHKARVNTRKIFGVSDSTFIIDYSHYDRIPGISIFLVEKNDCMTFYPKIGKVLAYINRFEKGWTVELSNFVREYY